MCVLCSLLLLYPAFHFVIISYLRVSFIIIEKFCFFFFIFIVVRRVAPSILFPLLTSFNFYFL